MSVENFSDVKNMLLEDLKNYNFCSQVCLRDNNYNPIRDLYNIDVLVVFNKICEENKNDNVFYAKCECNLYDVDTIFISQTYNRDNIIASIENKVKRTYKNIIIHDIKILSERIIELDYWE